MLTKTYDKFNLMNLDKWVDKKKKNSFKVHDHS